MAKDDASDPFNAVPYDLRVVSVIGEVELLNEVRERYLKEGTPRHGPFGVETYEQVIELRRGLNRLLEERSLEDLQLVAAVRHLGRGEGESWKELARTVAEWYPTRDLATTQIKTRLEDLAKELETGLAVLEKELAE